ncbi:hypothetical protein AZI98_00415 [Aeribacillus pallidus]|uniref:Uncharacterized protein n=1 Tax=Aeribacillus pallidus TaxID=33936 RepID=A0A165ZA76_9BACI|nr:hypothetical protein AZI98_00415 [Aeribacillus pallidus]
MLILYKKYIFLNEKTLNLIMCIIQQQEKFKNVFLKIFLCSENSFEYIRGEAIGVVFLKGSRKSTLSNYLHK